MFDQRISGSLHPSEAQGASKVNRSKALPLNFSLLRTDSEEQHWALDRFKKKKKGNNSTIHTSPIMRVSTQLTVSYVNSARR